MAMYVKSEYDGFICTVTVTSDTIDEIDLTAPDFRIDVVDQFHSADAAQQIADLLEVKHSYERTRDARTDIVVEGAEAHALYPDTYTFAEVSGFYDEQIGRLHYATGEAIDEINTIVKQLSDTMDEANVKVDECEYGVSSATPPRPGIQTYISEISKPMLSITCDGSPTYETSAVSGAVHGVVKSDVFANTDDETLILNGMQYWVSKDKKSLTFRFIPQPNAEYKFQSVVVVCALDYQNIARFEVCLMPRLLTGDMEKYTGTDPLELNPPTVDPVVPIHTRAITGKTIEGETSSYDVEDDYRPDYVFNDPTVDGDHFYGNNTPLTMANDPANPQKDLDKTLITPLYTIKSSAFITEDIETSGYHYNWGKFKSEIYDIAALSSMPIPFMIGTTSAQTTTEDIKPTATAVKLVPSYTGHHSAAEPNNTINVKMYEITQFIETTANVPTFSQNQVRVTVAI